MLAAAGVEDPSTRWPPQQLLRCGSLLFSLRLQSFSSGTFSNPFPTFDFACLDYQHNKWASGWMGDMWEWPAGTVGTALTLRGKMRGSKRSGMTGE